MPKYFKYVYTVFKKADSQQPEQPEPPVKIFEVYNAERIGEFSSAELKKKTFKEENSAGRRSSLCWRSWLLLWQNLGPNESSS